MPRVRYCLVPPRTSPDTQRLVDDEVRRILLEAYQQVTALLADHRDELDGLAHALLEHETLDGPAAHAAAGWPQPRGPERVLPLDSVRRDA